MDLAIAAGNVARRVRQMTEIRVAERFSRNLGLRYRTDGSWSGTEFLEDVLLPALEKAMRDDDVVVVNFDGVSGTPTSFLEEAFGGVLRRHLDWSLDDVKSILRIEAPQSPRLWPYLQLAESYMAAEYSRRVRN